jgi:hypothetical protein
MGSYLGELKMNGSTQRVVVDDAGRAVRVGPCTLRYLEGRGGGVAVLGTDARTGEPRRAVVAGGGGGAGGESSKNETRNNHQRGKDESSKYGAAVLKLSSSGFELVSIFEFGT